MSNTRVATYVLAIAGVLLVGSQVGDWQSRAAGPQDGLNVTVTNTPLPVTVTNPTVPPSTVNVGNAAALAAANAQASRGTPVSFQLGPAGRPTTYSVPVGQLLIIEYVSGECVGEQGTLGGIGFFSSPGLTATTGGFTGNHRFSLPIPFANGSVNAFTQQFGHLVKIYADGGSNVTLAVLGDALGCSVTFSGQLVTQ
jgi:hypothetical protein